MTFLGEAARVQLAEGGGEPLPPVEEHHEVRQPFVGPDDGTLLGDVREPAVGEWCSRWLSRTGADGPRWRRVLA